MTMKILLFGSLGQVGWQLQRSLSVLGEVIAVHRGSQQLCGDLRDHDGIAQTVSRVRPDVVVNAAAYTAVDQAEDERDLAFSINARACEALARATADIGGRLVHYSSDYVYPGTGERPWREADAAAPLSVYGQSKLAGDEAIARLNPRHLILRTSWVFETFGQNFVKSILKAAAVRDELKVVNDQWGSPTRAALIADVTAHALRKEVAGIYHVAAAGETTWHEYARFLIAEARGRGMTLRTAPEAVHPVPTSGYPARAPRPANSRLDTTRLRETFGLTLPHWQDGVRAVVAELSQ